MKYWKLTWAWPTGKMAWFLWGRSGVFPDTCFYRIGPLTLMVI